MSIRTHAPRSGQPPQRTTSRAIDRARHDDGRFAPEVKSESSADLDYGQPMLDDSWSDDNYDYNATLPRWPFVNPKDAPF
ncbi:hypothetical protein FB459_2218 [Yimella lutea]|uniref:Uncharacterized protein n=1 Tax=Yimella lutea TaxID=587872 RepID=A0A542EHA3_9MICO|nr:hypothetical protein [Yimella lutea]TQJ14717.1 hypothetical protein FB459_2218 [Yimella lutea]